MGEAIRTAVKAPETKKENQVSQVQKGNFCQPLSSPVEQILFLQRTIGNQAVQKLMKSGALQAKLRIGAPGDVYEQEADRVAEQVMQISEIPSQPKDADKPLLMREATKKAPELNIDIPIQRADKIGLQLKPINVGDTELPDQKDFNFTIATVLGESSAAGPINEKFGIAVVIKKRVENKLGGNSNFRNVILNTGIYGNPSLNKIANLAELCLNNKPDNLEQFQALVDQAKITGDDKNFLVTKGGYDSFVKRIEQTQKAVKLALMEAQVEPNMQTLAKEATWWGGEATDFWDSKCQMCKHGKRIMENELVFVVYQEIGKTYFLKEAKSISDKNVRTKEIERSKKFLCEELANKTTCKRETIIEKNPACNTVTEEKKEEVLQPKGASSQIPEVTPENEILLYSMKGSGQPLSDSQRAFFEPRFGQDFSGVRVHTDVEAEEAARAVNARAFTMGKDVVFGKGEYVPRTKTGQRLMAHELMHVVQQDRTSRPILQRQKPTEINPQSGEINETQKKLWLIGTHRARVVREFAQELREKGTTYNQEVFDVPQKGGKTIKVVKKDWNNYKLSDCTKFVQWALEKSGQGKLIGRSNTAVGLILEIIAAKQGNEKPEFKTDPLPGDLMLWSGHIAIVLNVWQTPETTYFSFAHMGSSGALISGEGDQEMKLDLDKPNKPGYNWRAWGAGAFLGFWTPPLPSTEAETEPGDKENLGS